MRKKYKGNYSEGKSAERESRQEEGDDDESCFRCGEGDPMNLGAHDGSSVGGLQRQTASRETRSSSLHVNDVFIRHHLSRDGVTHGIIEFQDLFHAFLRYDGATMSKDGAGNGIA